MNAVDVCLLRAVNVVQGDTIVELLLLLVCKVTETIPCIEVSVTRALLSVKAARGDVVEYIDYCSEC